MDKNSSKYVLFFVTLMTITVALVLTGLRQGTLETTKQNEAIFNKRAVLSAVNNHLGLEEGKTVKDMTDEQVLEVFDTKVTQTVLDATGQVVEGVKAEAIDMEKENKKDVADRRLPLFQYENDGNQFYIMSVRGKGLWDAIWGNIALESDVNTIAGASFDHKGETPGLGAEIKDNPAFADNFIGTQIYQDGKFKSVKVRKGGAQNDQYEVDGISGATVTADGVDKMLREGIALYLPYLETIKGEAMESMLFEK
ncbi:MAG: NADH:ubiquinone reductase (Na(+)-transporting) subunit C [Bacteroidota bacterium]